MDAAKVHLIEALEPRRLLDGTLIGMCCELECAGLVESIEQPQQIELRQSDIVLSSADGRVQGVLAEFDSTLSSEEFTVTIDWGDGRRSDAPVQVQSDCSYAVLGEHEYSNADRYDITIDILGSDGSRGYEYHLGWTYVTPLKLDAENATHEAVEPMIRAHHHSLLDGSTPVQTIASELFNDDQSTPEPKLTE